MDVVTHESRVDLFALVMNMLEKVMTKGDTMTRKIENPEELDVVEIEWKDSTSMGDGRWICVDEIMYDPEEDQALTVYSAGYLVKETENEYRIIQSYHLDRLQICSLLIIPKVAVVNIEILKEGA